MPHIKFLSSSPDLSLGDFAGIGHWGLDNGQRELKMLVVSHSPTPQSP